MSIKKIFFLLFVIGIISTIAWFYIMKDAIKEISVYQNGEKIAACDTKLFRAIQKEINIYANSGYKAFDNFMKQKDIYKMKETGNGVEIIYKQKTPAALYIPIDQNGQLQYIVYAASNGLYLDQPAWTSDKSLKTLQKAIDDIFDK